MFPLFLAVPLLQPAKAILIVPNLWIDSEGAHRTPGIRVCPIVPRCG